MQRPATEKRAGAAGVGVALLIVVLAGGASSRHPAIEWANRRAVLLVREGQAFYRRTPADERVTWGGLVACAAMAVGVSGERLLRVRRSRVVPSAYTGRFHSRLLEGKLDRGKALDFCELNPSPAARVVLAAVRRWGRPSIDLDRGVALARQIEVDRLRRNVGTLRRIAAIAPLIGLLGTLLAASRGLSTEGAPWAPAVARSLTALTAGVGLAILCLVAYDGLAARVEALAGALDRLGAEAVDAIAMLTPADSRLTSRPSPIRHESAGLRPSPHSGISRSEIPLEAD